MQYITLPGPLPAATDLVGPIVELLVASQAVTDYLGGAGADGSSAADRIFTHELHGLESKRHTRDPWAAVLVRIPTNPFGNKSSVIGRVRADVRVHVLVSASADANGYDARRYAKHLHQRIDDVLRGRTFALPDAVQAYPLFRYHDPGTPQYDDDHKTYRSVSTYLTHLDPVAP